MNTQTEQIGSKSRLYSVLHLIAAVILLLFAASHFAFLTVPDISHNLQNPVFPIIPNKIMYLIAGLFEAVTGLLCLKLRGRDAANIVILTFVGVILWYRWAFYFVGGTQCSCLGILGRLLHLSKTQEKVLPILALIVLTMTTLPWLIRILWNSRRRVPGGLPLLFAMALLPQVALGQKSVEVTGELNLKVGNPGLKLGSFDYELIAKFEGCRGSILIAPARQKNATEPQQNLFSRIIDGQSILTAKGMWSAPVEIWTV